MVGNLRPGLILVVGTLLASGAARAAGPAAGPAAERADEFFERRVRPVLVEQCQSCHGPEKQRSALRVDHLDHLLKGGDGGPALVPGDPGRSRLIAAVRWEDPDLQMPPKKKLALADIEALERWVTMGAPWPAGGKAAPAAAAFDVQKRKAEHWAWRQIVRPPVPAVKGAGWARDEVDRFILAALEARGLKPAPEADRRTLIRRVTFDLTGLPPTVGEVEAFVADGSPDAYEKVVDRLLASPHFGERWARHWMDLVRYAETRGHEFDPLIPHAWRYRDYLVRAFNADVPHDRLVLEHLAGDLLEEPRLGDGGVNESILGTGFWFLGEEVHSPVDIRQDETDRLDNRLDTMTKAFLGLTVACARCHDHKFDAISQRDYYAMQGFLVSSTYRQARFATMERERQVAAKLAELDREARRQVLPLLAEALRPGVEAAARELMTLGPAAKARRTDAAAGQRVIIDFAAASAERGTWVADGFAFGLGPARVGDVVLDGARAGIVWRGAAQRDPAFRSIRAEALEKDHGPLGTWDRSGRTVRTPKVTLGTGRLWYLVRGPGRAYAAVDSHLNVAGPLHGRLLTEWKGEPGRWQWVGHDLAAYAGHRAHVEFSPASGDADLAVAMVVEAESATPPPLPASALDELRAGAKDAAALAAGLSAALDAMARGFDGDAREAQRHAELADWMARRLDALTDAAGEPRRRLDAAVSRFARRRTELAAQVPRDSPTAPAMLDGNGVDEFLLRRGSPRTPGEAVPRRFLEAIAGNVQGEYGPGSGRLRLARRMLADDNPFVARVAVNRVWHHLFGVGIVPTVDNLGALGQPPSHPELLDFLADGFRREGGWSTKRLIRRLVLSATYRQSGRVDPAAQQADPLNALLHHRPVRRLTAEAVRDAMLAVSGRLDRRVTGGPPVEVHLTEFMDGRGRPGTSGPLDGDGRRSLYVRVRRNFLSPMMLAFDAPIPFQAQGRRNVSNVPAQALILMNDPFVHQQAKLWARRVVGEVEGTEARVARMYAEAFARPPTAAELAEAKAFVSDATALHGGSADRAWADLAHVLMNVKEFVFVP